MTDKEKKMYIKYKKNSICIQLREWHCILINVKEVTRTLQKLGLRDKPKKTESMAIGCERKILERGQIKIKSTNLYKYIKSSFQPTPR